MIYPFLILIALSLFGCSQNQEGAAPVVFSGTAMTINYRILIAHPLNQQQHQQIDKIIKTTFDDGNRIYNKWNPDSELSKLNQMKAGQYQAISPELLQLLKITDEVVQLSGGLFDPTIEPLQRLWKDHLEKGTEPSQQAIDAVLPAIGWQNIHFEKGIFHKDHDGTELDLGGIAKGFLVDTLAERLRDAGYPDVFVEWGGEIRAHGKHPENRDWNIYISNEGDVDPAHAVAIVSLKDQAIATSGDYQQYWILGNIANNDEIYYFHIINPKTHRPLQRKRDSITSVSVLSQTCALADGLATTALLFPNAQEASAWAEKVQQHHSDIAFWFVSRDQNK